MLSGFVSSVQLLSTELALKAIQAQQDATAHNATAVLLNEMEAGSATMADADHNEQMALTTDDLSSDSADSSAAEIPGNIATVDFMKSLKTQLFELAKNPDSMLQGSAMLQALKASTLKVFDPIDGIVIRAWDAYANGSGYDEEATAISPIGWSQFLRQRVKRAQDASYVKDESGNYIDAISGESAYFETVGSKYYYFTWS